MRKKIKKTKSTFCCLDINYRKEPRIDFEIRKNKMHNIN